MIFLLFGAPIVITIGIVFGIGITMMFLILFLSFANDLPFLQPIHIGVAIFLQCGKSWFKLTRRSFRLTKEVIEKVIDIDKLNKIPYIRVLPLTTPSKQAQFWDYLVFKEKHNTFLSQLQKPYTPLRVSFLRDHLEFSEPMFTLIDRNLCKIKIELVNEIPIHWIKYSNSSTNNGIIICIHGGGYVAGMPSMQYAMCSELSKLTGCVCLSIGYRLCPGTKDHPITITDALDDCFTVYKYLILKHIAPCDCIAICGESAGGGLALLLLQKIRDYNSHSTTKGEGLTDYDLENELESVFIGNPSCCWVSSPWTNLEMDSQSAINNREIDGMLVNDPAKYFQRMAIGQIDINLNVMNDRSLKDKRFSPLFGEWNDLCPLYFMVGATEILLDDTLDAAERAYDEGVDVRVDIEPFMHHTFPLFLRTVPEAKNAVIRASDFIIKHLKIC